MPRISTMAANREKIGGAPILDATEKKSAKNTIRTVIAIIF